MAIKVNGTTVIDDSRNLSNVGGLKTVNGSSLVGSGNISAGQSTSYNAVGTYCIAAPNNINGYTRGTTTISGSNLKMQTVQSSTNPFFSGGETGNWNASAGTSGTYRACANSQAWDYQGTRRMPNLFIRIS